jgi:maltodextrin utilization protein YvdJ
MFIIRFFKHSVDYPNYFEHTKEKGWKVFTFFILVSLISLFPMNLLIVQEDGWKLDFIEQSFIAETPDWQLPDDCRITANQFVCDTDTVYVYEHDDITYIFNTESDEYQDNNEKSIIFMKNKIVYTNGEGAYMTGYDYNGFDESLSFRSLNLATGEDREQMYEAFGASIETSFGNYIIFYTLLVNIGTSIGLYAFFVLVMSLVIQLFRFGYSSFITFRQTMKMVVFAMGLPSIISFIVGFIEPTFAPVIFQFGIGIILMVVMLKYGKKTFK